MKRVQGMGLAGTRFRECVGGKTGAGWKEITKEIDDNAAAIRMSISKNTKR